MKGLLLSLVATAIALSPPGVAHAYTDGETAFANDMANMGIGAHHGHIDNEDQDVRPVLLLGYNFCSNARQYGVLDAKRVIMVNSQTRAAMGQPDQLNGAQIDTLASSAQHNLCPDI